MRFRRTRLQASNLPASNLPATPRRTALLRTTLLLSALLLTAPAVFCQTRLFLSEYQYNNPKLKQMNLDGSGVFELFTPPSADWLMVGCGFDPSSGKIYWTHGSSPGLIRRANLDGSGMQILVGTLKYPRGISLDRVNGKMYWAQSPPQGNPTGLIKRANLDGTGAETFFTLVPYDPTFSFVGKPCADPVNGYVYFCANQALHRKRMDGTGQVETLVRGVTTVTAVALDSANEWIYFVDANTNSDYVGRARMDNTEFTVLADLSPGVGQSSGLFDLRCDLSGGKLYFTDEIAGRVLRCNLDGSALEPIYHSPTDLSPTGICLDPEPPQPILDCNGNGVRDRDDIDSGTSLDCNHNGTPDECENHPCAPLDLMVDNGSDPIPLSRTLSGDPQNGYEIFQPFEYSGAPGETADLRRIWLDGWTVNYEPAGFRATLFPDDGSGTFPDENLPIVTADLQYRFSPDSVAWVTGPFSATIQPGRYWVRLSPNAAAYHAGVNVGVSGEHALSRRLRDGGIVVSSYSIAVRIERAASAGLDQAAGPGAAGNLRLDAPEPNPAAGTVWIGYVLDAPAQVRLGVYDSAGRRVRMLRDGESVQHGRMEWDLRDEGGRAVSAGVYFLRMEAEAGAGRTQTASRRIVVAR